MQLQQLLKLAFLYLPGKVKQRKSTGGVLNKLLRVKGLETNMILDDGGDLTALMHKDYKNLLKDVKGSF